MTPVNKKETVPELLKDIKTGITELNEKKQTQIDNQQKFENKWSKFKVIAATFAIGTPLVSLLTGIIDPAVDMPILAERANAVLSQVYRFFGG